MTPPLELTNHPAMAARVRRQVVISAVALGGIWALWAAALDTPAIVGAALAAGWVLMPLVLALSLRAPRLRYALVVPAVLVSVPLLAVCMAWLPDGGSGRLGWPLITAGILAGGALGGWFWYRMVPVPAALHAPYAPGRWALIAGHVGMIAAGMALVAAGRF